MYEGVLGAEEGDAAADDLGFEAVVELLVVLVDCHPSMLAPRETLQGASCHKIVVDSVVKHMKRRIIASKRDEMGVVFYGTEHQNAGLTARESLTSFDSVFVQQMLQPLTAKAIKDMETIAEPGAQFASRIGSCAERARGPDNLKNALWTCSQMFSKRTAANVQKRVFIFTDDDLQSVTGDEETRMGIESRVEDLLTRKISVDLFPISPGETFNMAHFWKGALQLKSGDDAETVVNSAAWRVEELTHALFRRTAKKRPTQSTTWRLLDGVAIAVQMFAMVSRHTKPAASNLEARTNEEVLVETSAICQDTGAQLSSVSKKYLPVRGDKIVMDAAGGSEVAGSRDGLVLLGFKSRAALKDYHNMRTSYFVYPNEKALAGSKSTFVALHFQMFSQSQIAIVRVQGRGPPTSARLAALVAQPEVLLEDDSGARVQVTPPGMNMIVLPFAGDIRHAEDRHAAEVVRASDAEVRLAASVIDHLTDEDFRSTELPNPALQHYYAVLHALALGETSDPAQMRLRDATAEGVEDMLRDHPERAAALRAAVQRFKDAVPVSAGEDKSKAAGKKRPAAKISSGDDPKQWTVPTLKDYCAEHGLSASGKKVDLLERVAEHMEAKKK